MNKRTISAALVGLVLMVVGCGAEAPNIEHQGTKTAAIIGPTVTTDHASYVPGQSIGVSWAGLPGNATDWVAIAPQGSAVTSVLAWVYTGGATSGSTAFPGLSSTGTYVARAFDNDSYNLLAESTAFDVVAATSTLVTDASSYGPGQAVNVNWTGLPGNATDWIAIAPPGSPVDTITTWAYTGGGVSGSHAFSGLAAGSYVARAFPNDTYNLIIESATFTVGSSGSATVSTDQTAYGFGQSVVVTWTGLPGNATDWIALAPAGSSVTSVTRWAYTGGAASGSVSLEGPASGGAYVARAFLNDSYTLGGPESATFTIGLGLTTDKSAYAANENISVTWQNLTSNPTDWIAIAPAGSPNTTVTEWVYTGGASSGTNVFAGLSGSGTYVARAFLNDTYGLLAESAPFTVGLAGASVVTDASTYAVGNDIQVTWAGLQGNATDWVAIAPAGSSPTTVTVWVYTGGAVGGSTTFVGGVAAGTWVARAFQNDSYVLVAESASFTVN